MADNRRLPAIKLEADPAQIAQITAELREIKNGVAKAIAPAINKTLAKGQTELIKGLADILTAKRANIVGKADNRRIKVIKANAGSLSGRIQILARKIGLINFKVQDTRGPAVKRGGFAKKAQKKLGVAAGAGQGVIVQVRKNEAPLVLPKAFVATGLSDNRHVFERFGLRRKQGKGHYKPNIGKMRQPIRSYKGESLHEVWKDTPSLRARVQAIITAEFSRQITSQVDRLLKRKKT